MSLVDDTTGAAASPFDLWGGTGYCSTDAVGEFYRQDKGLLRTRATSERTTTATRPARRQHVAHMTTARIDDPMVTLTYDRALRGVCCRFG